jgi:hypothetical protein
LPTPRHHALNKADKSYATIRQILVGIARWLFYSIPRIVHSTKTTRDAQQSDTGSWY